MNGTFAALLFNMWLIGAPLSALAEYPQKPDSDVIKFDPAAGSSSFQLCGPDFKRDWQTAYPETRGGGRIKNKTVNADIFSGLVGLTVAAVFWFSIEEVSWLSIRFPQYLIGIIVALSAVLLIKGCYKPEKLTVFNDGNNRRIIITGAALFVWCTAINYIGFYVSSVMIITFLAWFLAKARRQVSVKTMCLWLLIITLKVGFFYLVFTRLLFVPLPKGILI